MVKFQAQQLGIGTRYGLEILLQCGKKVKTKSQKVLGANSNICRSYKEKTGRDAFLPQPSWIGLIWLKVYLHRKKIYGPWKHYIKKNLKNLHKLAITVWKSSNGNPMTSTIPLITF